MHRRALLRLRKTGRRFSDGIRRLGYSIIETVHMEYLKIVVQRLRIPKNRDVAGALKELRRRYRGQEIDANHHFVTSGGN
ncbi:MAG: hypothetical protein ACTSV1_04055 [Alphaproteobacteria bacterium]